MLKRLRSAHPMLYCLVAEVLFLGMLFVASLLSLLLILFVVRDIDAVDALPNVSENEETLLTGVNENVYEDQSIGAELTNRQ